MMSSVFAIIYTGAKPVLVDAEPDTWNIDAGKIAEKVTKKTKAIMPVHIYGHPCDMDPIKEIAQDHDLYVIEDAAEAHGAEYKGKKTGGIGDISCFSFYANKIITTGEGGMIVTNDDALAERAASLRNLAFSKDRRFQHVDIGYNYRMTNIQAAIGLAQFERIEELVEKRRRNAKLYSNHLKAVEGITLPVEKSYAKNVYWMYGLTVDERNYGMGRDELMKKLAEKEIETRTFFIPANQVNALGDKGLFRGESYPVAERLGEEGLYLPSGSGLKEEDIKHISGVIKDIQAGIR
jgi:perosamine synthetase